MIAGLDGSQCRNILWIQLLQIAQDPHLKVTLAAVGGACMAVPAIQKGWHPILIFEY